MPACGRREASSPARQHEELGLTREDVGDLVDALWALAAPHEIFFLWRPYLRDPKDELVT